MKKITAKEVEQRLENGEELNIIDVREVAEVNTGKIPTAVNIPLGLVEFKMPDLDKKIPYIIVCRSGGRSGQATQFLESYGFNVTNMEGGMLVWEGELEF
ncbi:rhodanese-like domain-containing protein [Neobacillus kokaensis]|uniref:Rhodanese-like domain-containing protein n=1 Tax=Neobacillus kokaensis TaxID=2759023 RepID=A0ABQ3N4P1_9BACI|nr:rhodanese-like domain-containing protein [Neobacillus kokaensis]GHH99031.1 rhodanese-like domain-containing protein [Neobacillus kokaensis]